MLGLEATQVAPEHPAQRAARRRQADVRARLPAGQRGNAEDHRRARDARRVPAGEQPGRHRPADLRQRQVVECHRRSTTSSDLKARRLKLTREPELPAAGRLDHGQGKAHFEVTLDVDGSPNSPVSIPCDGCHNIIGTGIANFQTFHLTPTSADARRRPRRTAVGTGHDQPQRAAAGLHAVPVAGSQRAFPAAQFTFTNVLGRCGEQVSVHVRPGERAAREHSRRRSSRPARDPHTKYMALVINTGGFMRGCSSGVPDSPIPASSRPRRRATTANLQLGPQAKQRLGRYRRVVGRLVRRPRAGPTFGRKHPGFCNGNSSDDGDFANPNGQISDNLETFVGLDRGDAANGIPMAVISPFAFDIMTYCNQPQWYSAHNYIGVFQRFDAENGFSPNDFAPSARRHLAATERCRGGIERGARAGLERRQQRLRQHRGHRESHEAHGGLRLHRSRRPCRGSGSAAEPAGRRPLRRRRRQGPRHVPDAWVRENSDLDQTPGADRTGLVQIVVPVDRAAASRSSSCWKAR